MRSLARGIAWALVALTLLSIGFIAWHQSVIMRYSEKYGIETSWLKLLPGFILFSLLPAAAVYAAVKEKFGPSIILGVLGFAFAGFVALILLAGVGT